MTEQLQYIDLCAAINHAQTYTLPYPREWMLLKHELKQEWCRAHDVLVPPLDTVVDLTAPTVSDAEREFSADAYAKMMSQSSKLQDAKQVPWWDFFLKVQ